MGVISAELRPELCRYPWVRPHLSSNEDGWITFAWHKESCFSELDNRELHIESTPSRLEYTKVWEDHTSRRNSVKMDAGVLKEVDDLLEVWEWLQAL